MSRVLLLCPEPLGHHHPAGVGIRFLELARALRADGHEVAVLSPDGGAVPGCDFADLSSASIRERTTASEVVLVQGHIINELLAHGARRPLVVDLYDPWIVENFHYWDTRGDQVFRHDRATLDLSLRHGDLFLCASQAQRLFYAGLLLSAGRLNPESFHGDPRLESLLRIVPFGVQPPRQPGRLRFESREIFFGAVYDWYDPRLAIEAVRRAREVEPELTLTFTHHPNAGITPQSLFAQTRDEVEREGLSEAIRFEPWVAYENRAAFYDRFAAALLTFRPSLETDLAMRTRMFDCFWAGLPVITSSAGGTDALIEGYRAGVVVEGDDPAKYADALLALLHDRPRYQLAVEGARRFTDDHQWSRVAEPLLQFCRNPREDGGKGRFARDPAAKEAGFESLLRRVFRRRGGS